MKEIFLAKKYTLLHIIGFILSSLGYAFNYIPWLYTIIIMLWIIVLWFIFDNSKKYGG